MLRHGRLRGLHSSLDFSQIVSIASRHFETVYLFAMVPDSRINSWESWFIFNLWKINTNKHYESDSLNAGNSNMICEYMTLQDDKSIIITVHTWTAVLLKHLANTSFMASFRASTEPHSGLSLWACILLPRPAQYLAVYCNGSSFTFSTFAIWVASHKCTSKHHNNSTWHMDTCTYITLICITINSFFFFTHLPFSWAGWLCPTRNVCYTTVPHSQITFPSVFQHKLGISSTFTWKHHGNVY